VLAVQASEDQLRPVQSVPGQAVVGQAPLCQPGPVLATWAEMTLDTITGTRKTSFGARPAAAVEAPGAHT